MTKKTRPCMRCKLTQPTSMYRPYARRCQACDDQIALGGTCACCHGPTVARDNGHPRLYCDLPACQREKQSASTRQYYVKARQIRDAATHRTCTGCAIVFPLTLEYWGVSRAAGHELFGSCCRPCRAAEQRDRYRTSPAMRASARRRAAKRRALENERRAIDPEYDAFVLARNRAKSRAWKASRKQKPVTRPDSSGFPELPALPLAAAIYARVGDGDLTTVCGSAGIDVRNLQAWRTGERSGVHFDVADRVLTNMGIGWWDVWDQNDPRVTRIWVGEEAA